MKRSISMLATAIALFTGCGPGADTESLGVTEEAFNIPDNWDCSKVVWEAGGSRTLGNNSFRVDVGVQGLNSFKMYPRIDGARDSIATFKQGLNWYSWTSTVPVRAIIASAGEGATTIFDYRPGRLSGGGVNAVRGTTTLEPVYLLFCFDAPADVCAVEEPGPI